MGDLALKQNNDIVPISESTALIAAIERAALNPAVDIDKMERLLAMQERIMAKQAEIAFNAALARVQSNLPRIEKKSSNAQTKSTYAKLEAVNEALVPVYSIEGFAISWGEDQAPHDGYIRIVGDLSHAEGHSKRYHIDIPLDNVGAQGNANKTKVHATGSSISYGRRYLTLMMFNASTYDDVDGNGGVKTISDKQEANIVALISETKTSQGAFLAYLKIDNIGDLPETRYREVVAILEKKRKQA